MTAAAQAALFNDYRWVIIIAGILATLLLLAMFRLPAALVIIILLWSAAWMVGAL